MRASLLNSLSWTSRCLGGLIEVALCRWVVVEIIGLCDRRWLCLLCCVSCSGVLQVRQLAHSMGGRNDLECGVVKCCV